MKRRDFIKQAAGTGLVLPACLPELCLNLSAFPSPPSLSRVEARYYKKLPDREILCQLCPRECLLGDKERGFCGVRENDGGTYYTLVYGKPCSLNVDPIEKKPFFHFQPGTTTFSLATAGCNVHCKFCQNWEISQVRPEQIDNVNLSPEEAVSQAEKFRCSSIAFTYTEPVIFYEYMFDISRIARRRGLKNAVVTNGFINSEPLKNLLSVVDAIKVDLKAFDQNFYSSYVRGNLDPVLEAIKIIGRSRVWLEIVYLIIPTLNDDLSKIRNMARWIKDEVGANVPVHFSRFTPMYLLKNLPPTPISSLEAAQRVSRDEGLKFVYVGNVPGHEGENTYCPSCQKIIIRRSGYKVETFEIKNGNCEFCGAEIPGVWT